MRDVIMPNNIFHAMLLMISVLVCLIICVFIIYSPAYKNGSILTSIKIGNSFLTLRAVIQSESVQRRLLARSCGLLSLSDDMLLIRCWCKFSLSFSTRERSGQLWCNKKLFLLWKFLALRDLDIVTPLHFHRCFCDLLHLFVSSISTRPEHFPLMSVDDDEDFRGLSIDLLSI